MVLRLGELFYDRLDLYHCVSVPLRGNGLATTEMCLQAINLKDVSVPLQGNGLATELLFGQFLVAFAFQSPCGEMVLRHAETCFSGSFLYVSVPLRGNGLATFSG